MIITVALLSLAIGTDFKKLLLVCPETNNNGTQTKLPNPKDCSSYFACLNDFPVVIDCPEGLKFDAISLRCTSPDRVTCATLNETEPSASTVGPSTSSPSVTINETRVSSSQVQVKIITLPSKEDEQTILPDLNLNVDLHTAPPITEDEEPRTSPPWDESPKAKDGKSTQQVAPGLPTENPIPSTTTQSTLTTTEKSSIDSTTQTSSELTTQSSTQTNSDSTTQLSNDLTTESSTQSISDLTTKVPKIDSRGGLPLPLDVQPPYSLPAGQPLPSQPEYPSSPMPDQTEYPLIAIPSQPEYPSPSKPNPPQYPSLSKPNLPQYPSPPNQPEYPYPPNQPEYPLKPVPSQPEYPSPPKPNQPQYPSQPDQPIYPYHEKPEYPWRHAGHAPDPCDKDPKQPTYEKPPVFLPSEPELAELATRCPKKNERIVFFVNPKDCNSYYQCNWGYPILWKCPENLHFNEALMVCDWPTNAACRIGYEH